MAQIDFLRFYKTSEIQSLLEIWVNLGETRIVHGFEIMQMIEGALHENICQGMNVAVKIGLAYFIFKRKWNIFPDNNKQNSLDFAMNNV